MNRKTKRILESLKIINSIDSMNYNNITNIELIKYNQAINNIISIYKNTYPRLETLLNNGIDYIDFRMLEEVLNNNKIDFLYNYNIVEKHFFTNKLGLIKGRHELPVDNYILLNECNEFTKDKLQPIIYDRLKELNITNDRHPYIDLYITGLTIVSLITVEELKKMNKIVNIYGFNPNTQEYYLQGTF